MQSCLTNGKKVEFFKIDCGKNMKEARDRSYYNIMIEIFNVFPILFQGYL